MQQLLSEIAGFFRETDSFALGLLLAFLVPFVVTLLRPRQFGQNRERILERLQEIREKAIIRIAEINRGKTIIQVINQLALESQVILNPIKAVSNTAMMVFAIAAIAAGVLFSIL